ncbi:MAG: phosphoserine transaminase [Gammaproteobacteria bacterium]|jgi:phosphoserine aminotransferase|nr:phosphoserine transaminase [Gammaproteobacteria bacterium]MBT4494233.1 phosphoserine transaminase [Gammaproteobacteria bacterium]MBT7369444.1 phosphoserine transaminase [Gammaproteobacteria bacterium]
MSDRPSKKPDNPKFSSGPTSKRPGWNVSALSTDSLGRSHRAKHPKGRLASVISESKRILGIPDDYLLAIVPASDTGAFELALWTMIGERGVDVLSWESFGAGWVSDIKSQLKLTDVRELSAPYGELPDLNEVDSVNRDVVFTWNGTTSGVRVENADWISADREGLTFCDATSAVFAMNVDWPKLDVVTWSWQKALGGEAAHGMLALSPRAVERLESYTPPWPLPKIFRLVKKGKLGLDLFEGSTINTPSLLAAEDQLDALAWADSIGGLEALIGRSTSNLETVATWVEQTDWIDFLADTPATRSSTSICLSIVDPWFADKPEDEQRALIKSLTSELETEAVAYDIGGYRDAPPGLRIWGGGTVEQQDIEALLPWLDWAYTKLRG